MILRERDCKCGCGLTFKTLPTSKQEFRSLGCKFAYLQKLNGGHRQGWRQNTMKVKRQTAELIRGLG